MLATMIRKPRPKPSGPPSVGYFRRGGMLRVDANEAPIRRRIFELFAEHKRKKTVAEILNADGHRTRSGALFTGPTIGRLIKDKTVIGIEGVSEAIVPKELWEGCNATLQDQEKSGGAKRSVVHLFAGLVRCQCGEKMYVASRSDKYTCGACRTKIPKDDLEAIFQAQLPNYDVADTTISSEWESLSFEFKRELLELLVDDISIAPKRVALRLHAL